MSPYFIFLLAALATFRLSVMFSKENGPGRIFKRLRAQAPAKSSLREGLACPLCESIWWSALITALCYFFEYVPRGTLPIYWLAVSAGAVVLNQAFTKDL
jgi:hypothetical protein